MTKEREKEIIDQAKHQDSDGYFGFIAGAQWADENPVFEIIDGGPIGVTWDNGMDKVLFEHALKIKKLEADNNHLAYQLDRSRHDHCKIIDQLTSDKKKLIEALKEISLGRGPFNPDPYEHAQNTIECMKIEADQALKEVTHD